MNLSKNILKEYDFKLLSLKNKIHTSHHQVDDGFFSCFEFSPIEKGKLSIDISLDKTDNMLHFDVAIDGVVELVCDRSLEPFDYRLEKNATIVYKYGEEYKELADDLIVIPENTQVLNLANIIYELIAVEIPFKKIHPELITEWDLDNEDSMAIVYQDEKQNTNNEEDEIDPRWEGLKDKLGNK